MTDEIPPNDAHAPTHAHDAPILDNPAQSGTLVQPPPQDMPDTGYGQQMINPNGEAPRESNLIGSAHIRPIFLGNLDINVTAEEISDLFTRPAMNMPPFDVERVDLKRGFAFVFLADAKCEEDKDRIRRYVDGLQGMYVPTHYLST